MEHVERACFFAQGGKCRVTYFLGMLPVTQSEKSAAFAERKIQEKTTEQKKGHPSGWPSCTTRQSSSTAYTQPVGLGRPAILQAPLPGPDGNSS